MEEMELIERIILFSMVSSIGVVLYLLIVSHWTGRD